MPRVPLATASTHHFPPVPVEAHSVSCVPGAEGAALLGPVRPEGPGGQLLTQLHVGLGGRRRESPP